MVGTVDQLIPTIPNRHPALLNKVWQANLPVVPGPVRQLQLSVIPEFYFQYRFVSLEQFDQNVVNSRPADGCPVFKVIATTDYYLFNLRRCDGRNAIQFRVTQNSGRGEELELA
jgi:hypothetical protein